MGLPGLTDEEARAHFSLWAILAAPLIASCDLTKMSPAISDILKNPEVIAIDQDSLGKQGTRISPRGAHEVWVKQLRDGGVAVVLFNRGKSDARMSFSARYAGIDPSTAAQVRDVWKHEDRGPIGKGYSTSVPAHGAVMLRVSVSAE